MLVIAEFEDRSELEFRKPFDIGYDSGVSGLTIFDCPYSHASVEGLRSRHEWLDGFLTALSQKGDPGLL